MSYSQTGSVKTVMGSRIYAKTRTLLSTEPLVLFAVMVGCADQPRIVAALPEGINKQQGLVRRAMRGLRMRGFQFSSNTGALLTGNILAICLLIGFPSLA